MDTSSNTKLQISPLWLSGCGIVLWVSLPFLLNSAQPGDNIEQLVWAREFAWGYDKHPPFSTWLLIAAQNLFGRSPYLTYVLAVICNVATMYCMYKIAIEILDQETAIWVILILSLTYSFTRKAQYYNHNTVMLLGLSLTSLLTVYALRFNRWWNWTLLGFSAGALVLTKYQSFVGLALVGLILVRWQGVNHIKGEVIAIACMILVLTPHGDWLITNKGASPLEYAQVTLNPNQSTDQLKGLASYLLGLIKQYFLFAIFMLGAWIWRLKENERQAAAYQSISPFATSVMLHLTVGRALLMVLIALAGVRLQDHWAMPLALFMSLPIACYTRRLLGPLKIRHLNSLFFVQVIAIGFFTLQNLGYLKQQNVAHIERHLSVDNIVIATQKHWRKSTNCELHTLQGDPELTALYAAYSKENLRRVPDDWFDKNGGDEAMSKGVVRLHYKDRQGDRHDKFDDAFVVRAYDDRHGLPDRKVEVQFSYPKTSCR